MKADLRYVGRILGFMTFLVVLARIGVADAEAQSAPCPMAQIVLLVDQSGSMSGRDGAMVVNDPHNLRFVAVEAALQLLASASTTWVPGESVQVGVIYFGSRVEPVPLDFLEQGKYLVAQDEAAAESIIDAILQIPELSSYGSLKNTDFVAALRAAVDWMNATPKTCPPPQRRTIVLLTDGAPWLDEDEAPQYWQSGDFSIDLHMAAVREYVRQYYPSGDLYIVALDGAHRYWNRMASYWQPIVKQGSHMSSVATPEEMVLKIYQIIGDIVQNIPARAGIEVHKACGTSEIPPFTARITFRLFKTRPDAHLTIRDSNGQIMAQNGAPARGGVTVRSQNYLETVTIESPVPGKWEATVSPGSTGGVCNVFLERITLSLNLVVSQGVLFETIPVELKLTTARGGAPPLAQMQGAPPQVTAWLLSPTGKRVPLNLQEQQNLAYRAEFVPQEEGDYQVQAYMTYNGQPLAGDANHPLSVGTLHITRPRVVWYDGVTPGLQYPQYQERLFVFDLVDAQGRQVELAHPLRATLQIRHGQREEQVPFQQDAQEHRWKATYTPVESGPYTFHYRLEVTPSGQGPQVLAEGEWDVEVYAVSPLKVEFHHTKEVVVRDWLNRPRAVILPFTVVDFNGQPVDVSPLVGDKAPFAVELYGGYPPSGLRVPASVVAVGKGQYEIRFSTLNPGSYTLHLLPQATLPQEYLWQGAPWKWSFEAVRNPGFYGVLGGMGLLALVVVLCGWTALTRRRAPRARLEVFETSGEEVEELPRKVWHVQGRQVYARRRWPTWYWPCPFPVMAAPLGLDGVRKVVLRVERRGRRRGTIVKAKIWVANRSRPYDLVFPPGGRQKIMAVSTVYWIVRHDGGDLF